MNTGGHIGDGIRPSERRKGYATAMIALALDECKKLGINKVLICCDKDNIGSAKSIIHNGGVLENEVEEEKEFIPRMIEHAKQISEIEIHLAFVQHENRKVLIWEPVNVCKYGNGFYHIFIRDKALLIHSQEITENITRYPKKDCDGLFSLQNGQIQEIGIPAGGLPKQRYPLSGPRFQQAEFYYSIDLTNMKVLLIYEFGPRWSRCLEYQLIDEGDDTYTLGEVKVKWVS